ncbi:MAG: NUDIX domain-containing protein [Halomonas sp.]|uniref:NUDIX domain-containing protein n=1 Tax=Halomonas sp. TaxID=1486246 RepID=UPI003F928E9D
MLEKLRERLQVNTPTRLTLAMPEAAVLIPLVMHPEPTLLFTLRAAHLATHSGQVAFPGGKRETSDTDLLATALRESEEELLCHPLRLRYWVSFLTLFHCMGSRSHLMSASFHPTFRYAQTPAKSPVFSRCRSGAFWKTAATTLM